MPTYRQTSVKVARQINLGGEGGGRRRYCRWERRRLNVRPGRNSRDQRCEREVTADDFPLASD
jgi:hypothetical protein